MKERILIWLAWRTPRSLVYWCTIRLMVHATVGRYSSQVVPELTVAQALQRWGDNGPGCEPMTGTQQTIAGDPGFWLP